MRYLIFLSLMAAILVGCAGAVPWNPQGYDGLTMAQLEFSPPAEKGGAPSLAAAKIWNGKEQAAGQLHLTLTTTGLVLDWSTTDERAFAGQAGRSQTEQAVNKDAADSTVKIAPAVIEGAVKALGVP